jgi:limonene-1,2-epoxide hydrolase
MGPGPNAMAVSVCWCIDVTGFEVCVWRDFFYHFVWPTVP